MHDVASHHRSGPSWLLIQIEQQTVYMLSVFDVLLLHVEKELLLLLLRVVGESLELAKALGIEIV